MVGAGWLGGFEGMKRPQCVVKYNRTIIIFIRYFAYVDCFFFALYRVTADPSDNSTATASSV
jgi:hypothetical protein